MQIQIHEAVGDAQVNNLVTEMVVRTGGFTAVTPATRTIWGAETMTLEPPGRTDLQEAVFIYDDGFPADTEDNLPPEDDNGIHGDVRRFRSYIDQVGPFLEQGLYVQVCDGPCDPN